MDKILIGGLQFYGHHGVSEEERRLGGPFRVDLEIYYDLSRAAESDDLSHTIDYGEVCRRVERIGRETQHHLLESLAEAMAREVLESFPAQGLLVRLQKLNPPLDSRLGFVGVEIRRGRVA
ncbi:MAG: dihydroneopterin aldolase [candidate division NC10 bacterium]|nr:dihydroneopterin aldolase [candidate division NC10 bacterium]